VTRRETVTFHVQSGSREEFVRLVRSAASPLFLARHPVTRKAFTQEDLAELFAPFRPCKALGIGGRR
jgi:hypothetical protein